MSIGLYTIILFNIERYLVISLSIGNALKAKVFARRARFIIVILCLLESCFVGYFSNFIMGQCMFKLFWDPLSQYILSVIFLTAGGCYITGTIIFLPILNIFLALQIKTIMKASNKLRKHTISIKSSKDLRNIRLHLGQIYITVYILICLLPNSCYFFTNECKPIHI